jgi:hypothetical protein
MDYTPVILDLEARINALTMARSALIDIQNAGMKQSDLPITPKPVSAPPAKNAKVPAGKGEKVCNKCGKSKPYAEFPTNKGCAHGVTSTCKECTRNRLAENTRKRYAEKKAGRPAPVNHDAPESGPLNCKLCHAVCSTSGRLASHMRMVHGQQDG